MLIGYLHNALLERILWKQNAFVLNQGIANPILDIIILRGKGPNIAYIIRGI